MNLSAIISLIAALEPIVAPTIVTVESTIAAIKAAGGMTDPAAEADLIALVTEAHAAKAARDVAAAGGDPQ